MKRAFKLHWRGGDTQIVRGADAAEAMTLAGIGDGALRALDYYEEITDDDTSAELARREACIVALAGIDDPVAFVQRAKVLMWLSRTEMDWSAWELNDYLDSRSPAEIAALAAEWTPDE